MQRDVSQCCTRQRGIKHSPAFAMLFKELRYFRHAIHLEVPMLAGGKPLHIPSRFSRGSFHRHRKSSRHTAEGFACKILALSKGVPVLLDTLKCLTERGQNRLAMEFASLCKQLLPGTGF